MSRRFGCAWNQLREYIAHFMPLNEGSSVLDWMCERLALLPSLEPKYENASFLMSVPAPTIFLWWLWSFVTQGSCFSYHGNQIILGNSSVVDRAYQFVLHKVADSATRCMNSSSLYVLGRMISSFLYAPGRVLRISWILRPWLSTCRFSTWHWNISLSLLFNFDCRERLGVLQARARK